MKITEIFKIEPPVYYGWFKIDTSREKNTCSKNQSKIVYLLFLSPSKHLFV